MATLDVTVTPPTKDALGGDLPVSGPGSLTSHRVEYGTVENGDFGKSLGEQSIAMPRLEVSFSGLAPGVYAVRAYASNSFGEGGAGPASIAGPAPAGANILIVRVSA